MGVEWNDRWYQIVPRTDYVAWRVFRKAEWIRTDIIHVGDDPLFDFMPEDDADAKAVNSVHRAPFRKMSALSKEAGQHIEAPLDAAAVAERRLAMKLFMRDYPAVKIYTSPCGGMGYVKG